MHNKNNILMITVAYPLSVECDICCVEMYLYIFILSVMKLCRLPFHPLLLGTDNTGQQIRNSFYTKYDFQQFA
jgi:hypothetical protein